MAGAGAATALLLPKFLDKDAAEFAASSNKIYSTASAKGAQAGQKFIFHGTIASPSREFEKSLVVGTKSVWKGRDRRAAKRAGSREAKQRARAGWKPVAEYTQVLSLTLDTGSKAELRLDSIRIEGPQERVEETVAGEKFQWHGLRRGAKVSVRGTIESLDPFRIEQTRGQALYVGTPDSLVKGDAASSAAVSKWTYLGGLGFAGLGGLVLLLGMFLRPNG